MAYKRKTIDSWHIHVNYGNGYEEESECVEFTRGTLAVQKKAYRENCGYPFKVVYRRMPLSEFSAEQLAEIENTKQEERMARVERTRQLLANTR